MPPFSIVGGTRFSISQEEQRIKDEAQANGTFMKALNGKPTNLTEGQWLQVRTQAFKKRFGDWEKHFRIGNLRKSESVSVEKIDYDGKYELDEESAQQWILDNLRKDYKNKDTGETVSVSRVGAEEVTSFLCESTFCRVD